MPGILTGVTPTGKETIVKGIKHNVKNPSHFTEPEMKALHLKAHLVVIYATFPVLIKVEIFPQSKII